MLKYLIIGIGNPSRGDDALGPRLIERLAERDLTGVELLTDFQLQVEYLLDLHGREAVIFVDASVSCQAPFAFAPAAPAGALTYTTHALSPEAVLAAYAAHYQRPPPAAHVLAIRGYSFELGETLSQRAALNLDAAEAFILATLDCWRAELAEPRGCASNLGVPEKGYQ